MDGTRSASWAVASTDDAGHPAGGVHAEALGDGGLELTGVKTAVQDVEPSSWLLVTAQGPDGPVAGARGRRCRGGDRHRARVARRQPALRRGPLRRRPGGAVRLLRAPGTVDALLTASWPSPPRSTAAETVGAMDHDFEMTLQYAKDRIAFGRPIGSFQAVKHLLADTSLALEMSKAVAWPRPARVGAEDDYGPQAASMAKAFVGEAGVELAQTLLPGLRRHRLHVGARPAPLPAPHHHRRRPLRRCRLAPRAPLPAGRALRSDGDDMTDTPIDVEEFRREARAWIEANLEPGAARERPAEPWAVPRPPTRSPRRGPAAAQAVRRRLRRHLLPRRVRRSGPHRRCTSGRSARKPRGYVTPDLGVAGNVTLRADRALAAGPRPAGVPAAPHPEDPARARSSGASSTPSPRPARTSPASAPAPSATVTAGSSPARRSGAAAPTTPTGRCAWPAPTGTCPSTGA